MVFNTTPQTHCFKTAATHTWPFACLPGLAFGEHDPSQHRQSTSNAGHALPPAPPLAASREPPSLLKVFSYPRQDGVTPYFFELYSSVICCLFSLVSKVPPCDHGPCGSCVSQEGSPGRGRPRWGPGLPGTVGASGLSCEDVRLGRSACAVGTDLGPQSRATDCAVRTFPDDAEPFLCGLHQHPRPPEHAALGRPGSSPTACKMAPYSATSSDLPDDCDVIDPVCRSVGSNPPALQMGKLRPCQAHEASGPATQDR